MMKRHRSFYTVVVLLTCASLFLTSCTESLTKSFTKKTPVVAKQHNSNGPADHAPAWGYRRKRGKKVVVSSPVVIGGTVATTSGKGKDQDDDGNDKTKLAVIGVAAGAGVVYGVINERDKKQTQAEMENIKAEMNVVTVNVTNSNGSVSPIKLTKQGVGYVGPQGEYYDHLPTPDELKPMYGL